MKEPILALEKETREILLFKSLLNAQGYIEPLDVDVYEVFDAEGTVILIHLEGEKPGLFGSAGQVRLEVTESKEPEKLRTYLRDYLQTRQANLSAEPSLDDLVGKIQKLDKFV